MLERSDVSKEGMNSLPSPLGIIVKVSLRVQHVSYARNAHRSRRSETVFREYNDPHSPPHIDFRKGDSNVSVASITLKSRQKDSKAVVMEDVRRA